MKCGYGTKRRGRAGRVAAVARNQNKGCQPTARYVDCVRCRRRISRGDREPESRGIHNDGDRYRSGAGVQANGGHGWQQQRCADPTGAGAPVSAVDLAACGIELDGDFPIAGAVGDGPLDLEGRRRNLNRVDLGLDLSDRGQTSRQKEQSVSVPGTHVVKYRAAGSSVQAKLPEMITPPEHGVLWDSKEHHHPMDQQRGE